MANRSMQVLIAILPSLYLPMIILELFHRPAPAMSFPVMMGMFAAGYLSFLFLIFVHELGHFVAGQIVGIQTQKFVVGSGWPVQFKLGGLHISLRPIPVHGFVLANPCAENFSLYRQGLFLSGGIIAQSLLMIFAYWYLYTQWSGGLDDHLSYLTLYSGVAMICFGTIMAINTIVPGTGVIDGNPFANDGLQLSQLWKGRKNLPHRRAQIGALPRIYLSFEKGNDEKGTAEVRDLCEANAGDFVFVHLLAHQASEEKQYAVARAIYEGMLAVKTLSLDERITLLDGLASLVIYHELWEWLPQAEQWIIEARKIAPDKITLDGTYGGVLADRGKFDEAATVLTKVYQNSKAPLDRLISAAYLAKISGSRGNAPEVENWLKIVRRLGMHHILVDRIKKELS